MKSNILITGGAGYIGTSLTPILLREGYNVTVLDSLMFGVNPIIPFFRFKNYNFIKGDVRDIPLMNKLIKENDIIIHLAAIVGFPACNNDPLLAKSVNEQAVKDFSPFFSDNQLILFGSTGSNYGSIKGVCTEESPLNPLTLYGTTKTNAEKILMENNNTIAYRFATAFGVSPRLRLDLLVNDFTYKAIRDGYVVVYENSFKRTFIHVQDIARSFVFAIENQDIMNKNVYNVGSNNLNYTKKEVCEMIRKVTKANFYYDEFEQDADKRDYVVSYEKINSLGFETSILMEEGINELVRVSSHIKMNKTYSNT